MKSKRSRTVHTVCAACVKWDGCISKWVLNAISQWYRIPKTPNENSILTLIFISLESVRLFLFLFSWCVFFHPSSFASVSLATMATVFGRHAIISCDFVSIAWASINAYLLINLVVGETDGTCWLCTAQTLDIYACFNLTTTTKRNSLLPFVVQRQWNSNGTQYVTT